MPHQAHPISPLASPLPKKPELVDKEPSATEPKVKVEQEISARPPTIGIQKIVRNTAASRAAAIAGVKEREGKK